MADDNASILPPSAAEFMGAPVPPLKGEPEHVEAPPPPPTTSKDQSTTQSDSLQKQILDMYKKGQDIAEEHEKHVQEQAGNMNQLIQSITQAYQDTVKNRPPLPQIPQPQNLTVDDQRARGKALMQYFAVALPLAALMGARGGAFAAGAWGGFGLGLKALVNGENEKADEMNKRATAVDQQAARLYNQQMEAYRAILGQQNQSLDAMLQQLNAAGEVFRNQNVVDAAKSKSWEATMNTLGAMEELQKKAVTQAREMQKYYRPPDWNKYAMVFSSKFQAKDPKHRQYFPDFGDVMSNNLPEDVKKFMNTYNYYDFFLEEKGKLGETPQISPSEEAVGDAADNLKLFDGLKGGPPP